ncbi:MAG: hypothetical protein U9R19_01665 [Bacteroidota bacterium]|nr:hypothetical protein [Bacteroidota bacterium]
MEYIKTDNRLSLFRAFLLLMITFLIIGNGEALAQKKSKKKNKNWEIELGISSFYDNNVLKYSEKYLYRFDHGQDEGRFHINTYDDFIINPSFQATYTFRVFGKLKSKINGSFNRKIYTVNDIKSWNYFSLGFSQYLKKGGSFKLYYSHIPNFYIRHFRDNDWVDVVGYTPEAFQPMGFAKDSYGFWYKRKFIKNTQIKLSFSYLKYFYNEHFTEYDCNNLVYEIKLYQPVHKKIKLSFAYQFVISDAKGHDEEHETRDGSDDSDGSYNEDLFIFGFNWTMPRYFNHYNKFDLQCRVQKRYFSSKHYLELDPTHAGRIDDNIRLYATYYIKLSKELKLSVFYNHYFRESNTSAEANKIYLSNEKNYSQYQLGLKINYQFKT